MKSSRCFSRHSIGAAMPDDSISNLYPPSDNYVNEDDGTRSPKILSALSTDALCRALTYLDGELPPGLPQDVVDEIVGSLIKHNALNATTLKVLRNCEMSSLSLAGCRGVTDAWLEPLIAHSAPDPGLPGFDSASTCVQQMDVDDQHNGKASEVFYNATSDDAGSNTCGDESSSSTSSYVSASSSPWTPTSNDQAMSDHMDFSAHEKQESQAVVNSTTSSMTLLDLRGSYRLTDRGLRHLSDLSSLEVARLDNCHSLVGRGLLAFSLSHRLHTLSLANCRRVTDEAIINISHLNSLEALSLDGCRCLTDRSLAAVSGLFLLKKLDLSQCDLITDEGLEYLQDLEEIEELSLGWCRNISCEGLDVLTRQPGRSFSLKILSLARCMITNTGVDYLRRLQNLEELDLNGCSDISSSALGKTLQHLTKLTNLDVSYCPGIL
jgi:Leucine-rich repeat (LRR) protein